MRPLGGFVDEAGGISDETWQYLGGLIQEIK